MDAQLKRGLMEICVLAATQGKDTYGYQIIKDISPKLEMTESTLYPILKRLETGNFLSVYNVEHNGRLRKYYRITDAGKLRINDFVREWDEVVSLYEFIKSGAEE